MPRTAVSIISIARAVVTGHGRKSPECRSSDSAFLRQDGVSRYLPSNAGHAIFALHRDASTLSPAAGLLVLLGWTILASAVAAYRLARTDA